MRVKKSIYLPEISGHSLKKINREIKSELSNFFDFKDARSSSILLQHYMRYPIPGNWEKKILIQPFDGTIISKRNVEIINKYDLLITPSRVSSDLAIKSGIKIDIEVIPNWWDSEPFVESSNYFNEKFVDDKYTFYSETTGSKRKNIINLIKYFAEAFSNHAKKSEVRLIVKLSGENKGLENEIKKITSSYKRPVDIEIINEFLEEKDLRSLREGIDCYVCLSHMEGFCIPLINALALKKDVICLNTKISGYADFTNERNSRLINCHLIPIDKGGESIQIYDRNSKWEEPDYEDYKRALIEVCTEEYKFDKIDDFVEYSRNSVMEKYRKVIQDESAYHCIISEGEDQDYERVRSCFKFLGLKSPKKTIIPRDHRLDRKKVNVKVHNLAHTFIQSHLDCLRKGLDSQSEYVIVCEGDFVLVRIGEKMNDLLNSAPKDWDVLYIGGSFHEEDPKFVDDRWYKCEKTKNQNFYIVKRKFIPRLISRLERRDDKVDSIFSKMQKEGVGNWYGLINDLILPSRKDKKVTTYSFINKSSVIQSEVLQIGSDPELKGISYHCIYGNSGYAEAAKDYIIGLKGKSIPIEVDFIQVDKTNGTTGERNRLINHLQKNSIFTDKVIIHTVCDKWEDISRKSKAKNHKAEIIGMTVWETDKIPNEWVEWMNSVDKIIVPSKWNAEVLKNCGVNKKIGVIPHIYKKMKSSSFNIEGVREEDYKFYTIGQWTERKGIEETIHAFLKSFSFDDPVCLIVKTFHSEGYSYYANKLVLSKIEKIRSEYENPARIIPIVEELTDEQISYLHEIGDCYLSLTKGEGWGLGMFDASGEGNPVICTRFGGQLDFTIGPYIDFDLVPVRMNYRWFNEDQNWAEPKVDDAVKVIKEFFLNRNENKKLAIENSKRIKDEFSYSSITNKMIEFLKEKP